MGSGNQRGTNRARSAVAVKCSPENVATAAAMKTGPRARTLDPMGEPDANRSRRYIQRPAVKKLSPSADGQKTVVGIPPS